MRCLTTFEAGVIYGRLQFEPRCELWEICMSDAVLMAVVLVIGVGALLALQHWLANVNRYREEMTDEEYEEKRERDAGLLGNAMMSIDQQIFRRSAERAVEYRIDAQQGQLPGGGGQGKSLGEENEENRQGSKE